MSKNIQIVSLGGAPLKVGTTIVLGRTVINTITLSSFGGTDSFKLTYDGVEDSGAFVRGTNATAAALQTALRTDTGNDALTVSGTTDAGPFTVTFVDQAPAGDLSVTSPSGCTGVVVRSHGTDAPVMTVDAADPAVRAALRRQSLRGRFVVVGAANSS